MGWDNPPVPWREFERRLSWGKGTGQAPAGDRAPGPQSVGPRSVGPRSVGPQSSAAMETGWEPAGAELHCHSSYSFLDGASSPADLVCEAAARGLSALAITDHDGMYGVPQFAQAAARLRDGGIRLGTVFGAELSLDLARRAAPPAGRCPAGRSPAPQRPSERRPCERRPSERCPSEGRPACRDASGGRSRPGGSASPRPRS